MNLSGEIPTLYGFENITLFWSDQWQSYAIKVAQGEYCVSHENIVMTTILGSCISACIYDPENGYGGMNHFMLPRMNVVDQSSQPLNYGVFSMAKLINTLLERGCLKENLRLKIVGGGRVLSCFTDIGKLNIDFIKEYLNDESLHRVSSDMGGDFARKLAFFPSTGRLFVSRFAPLESDQIVANEGEGYRYYAAKPR